MILWSDAEGFNPPSPRWTLIIVIVIVLGTALAKLWRVEHTSKPSVTASPATLGEIYEFAPDERLADLTETALAETRGIYVGYMAIRRERVRELRTRLEIERRINELTSHYREWQTSGREGVDPITLASRRVMAGDPTVITCW